MVHQLSLDTEARLFWLRYCKTRQQKVQGLTEPSSNQAAVWCLKTPYSACSLHRGQQSTVIILFQCDYYILISLEANTLSTAIHVT